MTARPDIESVKAMLFNALAKSYANPVDVSFNGEEIEVSINDGEFIAPFYADKLAATVSEWFAAHYEPKRVICDGKSFRLTNGPPRELSGVEKQLSQPLGGAWLSHPATADVVGKAMAKAVDERRAAFRIPPGVDVWGGMNAVPDGYKEWEPGETKRWLNDWGWCLTPCDPVTGDMPAFPDPTRLANSPDGDA